MHDRSDYCVRNVMQESAQCVYRSSYHRIPMAGACGKLSSNIGRAVAPGPALSGCAYGRGGK